MPRSQVKISSPKLHNWKRKCQYWAWGTSKSANATGIPPLARNLITLNPGYLEPIEVINFSNNLFKGWLCTRSINIVRRGPGKKNCIQPNLQGNVRVSRWRITTHLDRTCFSSSSVQFGPRFAMNRVEHGPPSTCFSDCSCTANWKPDWR